MKNSQKSLRKNKGKIRRLYVAGGLFLLFAFLLGVAAGSTPLTLTEIGTAIGEGATSPAGQIFRYVRLPRTAASVLAGAALAVSGALIQSVLQNSLASPGIIGVNAGAGLAVTLCTTFGLYGGWRLSFFAFLGAFAAVMLVSLCARKWGASKSTVILLGVAVNSLLSAVSDTVITLVPEVGVMSNDFRMGDFSAVTYQKLLPSAALIAVTVAVLLLLPNELDVLTLGESSARGLGMNVSLMRTVFLLLSALLAGCAVSMAGLLSFVGLIVPHGVRRTAGSRSAHLIPLCALYGGAFTCLCDTIARSAFSPYEIPVGIILAFLGAPFFVFLLVKGGDGHA